MKTHVLLFKLIFAVTVFFVILFIYRTLQMSPLVVEQVDAVTGADKVYEQVALKTQQDFKLIGANIFKGSGFEPGFNFTLSLAGTKFGIDLTSQYGETRYVGYIDLASQSTSTKIFSGAVLDNNNLIQNIELKFLTKTCVMPSGDEVAYQVDIKTDKESISGCAELQ